MRELGTLNGIQMRELEERKWKTFSPDFAAGGSHLDRPGMFTKKHTIHLSQLERISQTCSNSVCFVSYQIVVKIILCISIMVVRPLLG